MWIRNHKGVSRVFCVHAVRAYLVVAGLFLLTGSAFAAADLEIKSLQAVPDPDAKTIQLKLTWANLGPRSANHAGCNVYVYSGQRLVVSQNFSLQALHSGESRQDQLKVEYAAEAVTVVKVEIYDAEEPDLQPSTNFAQVNLKPPDYRQADLQILQAAVETEQPVQGKSAVISLQLRNNGPEASHNSKIVVDLALFGSGVSKTERRIARLAAKEEIQLKLPYPLPGIIPATEGVFRLQWLSLNPDLVDPNEQNSSLELPVQLVPRMPDLIPKDVTVDRRGTLSFSMMNKGNAIARDSVTALYVNGALVQRFNTPQLRAGNSQKLQYTASRIVSGSQIAVVADFNADVEEASEENNRLNYLSK